MAPWRHYVLRLLLISVASIVLKEGVEPFEVPEIIALKVLVIENKASSHYSLD